MWPGSRRHARRSYAMPFVVALLALVWTSTALAGGDHSSKRDKLGFWDSRHAPAAQQTLNDRAAELSANAPAAAAALKDSLGAEGLVNLDPLTRTARFVGKTDGFLTGPSSAPPVDIALRYIRANAAALGLSADALAALTLRLDYVDILGTHHLSFTQVVDDVTVFGNGVKVGVDEERPDHQRHRLARRLVLEPLGQTRRRASLRAEAITSRPARTSSSRSRPPRRSRPGPT